MTSSKPSDTEVQAYIRGTTPFKITLKSPSVGSNLISADCTCPAAKKGNLCKHIWATLLKTESDYPDFLDGKKEIEKAVSHVNKNSSPNTKSSYSTVDKIKQPSSSVTLMAARQAEYRKIQYQKQKLRAQEFKKNKKTNKTEAVAEPPRLVRQALYFFADNGFNLELPLDAQSVAAAKKKLSRVFHPDAGGTHDEILRLNANSEILIAYIKSKGTG